MNSEKIDQYVDKIISEFERRPIVTTLKGVIILWVLKTFFKWLK